MRDNADVDASSSLPVTRSKPSSQSCHHWGGGKSRARSLTGVVVPKKKSYVGKKLEVESVTYPASKLMQQRLGIAANAIAIPSLRVFRARPSRRHGSVKRRC